jgi:hypothetical protein
MDETPQSEPTGSACNHARRSAVYPVTAMPTEYEYHPFANAFPMMNDREQLDDSKPLRFLVCDGVPS